jgi:hypothetical protein
MNWYKKADMPLQVTSVWDDGTLTLLIRGSRYECSRVSPVAAQKLKQLIGHNNWSAAFKLVRSLECMRLGDLS